MRFLLNFVLLSCVLLQSVEAADDAFKKDQDRIAAAIEKIPASTVKMFLYSLDPHDSRRFEGKLPENSNKSFHQFPILGSVEIAQTQEKTNLLGALAKGVRESDGFLANCFDPRHGLRVISKSATNDFVICFSCLQVEAHGFSAGKNFLTTSSPQPIFNKVLDQYKLKKAE